MSFNLRYENEKDGVNAWMNRRGAVSDLIGEYAPDVLGTQEGLDGMLSWMCEQLPMYERYGSGREADGGGEHTAIFVNRERFEVGDTGQFWISPEPEVPGSKAWDTIFPRICTWCRLRERNTGGEVVCFNAHLDNRKADARRAGARIVPERMARITLDGSRGKRLPAVLCGDFNAHPDSEEVMAFCTDGTAASDERVVLRGCDDIAQGTFHGFTGRRSNAPIDYILTTPGIAVRRKAVDDRQRDGIWPSDHFPVIADLEVPVAGAEHA